MQSESTQDTMLFKSEQHTQIERPDNYLEFNEIFRKTQQGEISLIVLNDLVYLDSKLVNQIKHVKDRDKKIAICIGSCNTCMEDREEKMRMLSHLGIDIVGELPDDDALNDIALRSNVYKIPPIISDTTTHELTKFISTYNNKTPDIISLNNDPKFLPQKSFAEMIHRYQSDGKRVTVVSGVFDVLHVGHIDFFIEAKKQGDILIILTNSDFSAKNLPKNIDKDRPIHSLDSRVTTLGSIDIIDHIVPFDDPNVKKLLEQVGYITFVKTEKDLQNQTVVEELQITEQHGGRTYIAKAIRKPKQGIYYSSSDIIANHRLENQTFPEKNILKSDLDIWSDAHEMVYRYFSAEIDKISPLYDEIINSILIKILKLNAQTGIINDLRQQMNESLNESLSNASILQENLVRRIVKVTSQKDPNLFDNGKDYQTWLIPNLIMKIIGFNPEIFPIQNLSDDSSFNIINGIKLSNGKIFFFDSDRTYTDPFIFEERYIKTLPMSNNFTPLMGQNSFARRIYYYSSNLRKITPAISILLGERNNGSSKYNAEIIDNEIISLTRPLWQEFGLRLPENIPKKPSELPIIAENPSSNPYPRIIAHGGESVLNLKGSFSAENSKPGLIAALQAGIDVIELDIVPSKDGKWIVSHHIDLNFMTVKNGSTEDYTQEELTHTNLKDKSGNILNVNLMSLEEALTLIKQQHNQIDASLVAKIDIKHVGKGSLKEIINAMESSSISKDKIILTCGDQKTILDILKIDNSLRFELNTAESINLFMAYNLMDNKLMPQLFIEYIQHYANKINAKTISLMYLAMKKWGHQVFKLFVDGIHSLNLDTQVWIIKNIEDYLECKTVGADCVLMHDPKLIDQCLQLKKSSLRKSR